MEEWIKKSDAMDAVMWGNGLDGSVVDDICEKIEALPSVDRPRGEWIDMGDFEQCSVCKGTHLKEFQSYYGKVTWIKTPYCPSCGARMKGADDE